MFPILKSAEMGSDHRANGPRVRRAIRVPADVAVDRTHIQARATPNAVERIPLLGVRQDLRAPISRSTT